MAYRFAANDRRSSNYSANNSNSSMKNYGGATGSYSFTTSSDPRKASDDVVYFNIDVYNPFPDRQIPMELPPVTRTQNLLNRGNDYYCSVVRFQVPQTSVPYFNFPSSDPFFNDKQFVITMSDGVSDVDFQLQYVPTGIPTADGNLPIYFVNQFLKSVNDAFIAVNALAVAAPLAGITANPPYMQMRDDGKIQILVDTASTVEIFFNWNLYRLFDGIFAHFNGFNTSTGKDEKIYYLPADTGLKVGTNTVTIGGVSYYAAIQDFPGFYFWDSTAGIILTTSTLPILSEFVQGIDANGNNVTLNSLTDYVVDKSNGRATKAPFLFFSPEFRLIDMKGQDPVNKIDVKLYHRDTYNVIRPLALPPLSSFSVKLMFIKKSLYDSEYGGNAGMPLPILGV